MVNNPKSLQECVEEDGVVVELKKWSKRVKNIGFILMIATFLVGVFASISVGYGYYIGLGSITYSVVSELNTAGMLMSSVVLCIIIVVEYCLIHILSLILHSLALIVKNSSK